MKWLVAASAMALMLSASGCGGAKERLHTTTFAKPATTSPRPKPPRLDAVPLFVFQPGKRANRLIGCVRKQVAGHSVSVRGPHIANNGRKPRVEAYFFIAWGGRPGRNVRELVRASLRACDARWRDLVLLAGGQGGGGGGGAIGSN